MADIIWVDGNGTEIKREVKGRGRPPKGAERREDGNLYVSPSSSIEKFVPKYITLDSSGNVVKTEDKGRGRAKPGFEKASEGSHEGHWVRNDVADSA